MLPFALYSDIQNLLVSASAIRHCVIIVCNAFAMILIEVLSSRRQNNMGLLYFCLRGMFSVMREDKFVQHIS
jgi:hypothetical protein